MNVAAGQFKQQCLALMDQVAMTGEELVITKHGIPVCRLAPLKPVNQQRFGIMKDTVKVMGDITLPLDELWDAQL